MKRRKFNNKGFSLVELIAAVAILAVVVTPLLHSFVTSTNISRRATRITEATLAGKNILEAVDARPIAEFQKITDTNLAAELLGNGGDTVDITPIGEFDVGGDIVPDDEGGFDIALQNIRAGNAYYDAKVEFSRGDNQPSYADSNGNRVDSTSYGIYEINSERIAKYSSMDGVFCQQYLKTDNPDYLADEAFKTEVELNKDTMYPKYKNRSRYISMQVYKDSEGLVWARVTYTYTFEYYGRDASGARTDTTNFWQKIFNYSLFPGGYEPRNKDGSVNIYFMYYPDYYADYTDDTHYTVKARKDTIDIYNIAESGYDVDLKVFLYKQKPVNYYSDNYEPLDTTGVIYKADLTMFKPDDYEITEGEDRKTLVYTNVDEEFHRGPAGEYIQLDPSNFRFILAQAYYDGFDPDDPDYNPEEEGAPQINYPIETPPLEIDLDLVRKDEEIRIYNIKITLYPQGSFVPSKETKTIVIDGRDYEVDDTSGSTFTGEPIYVVEGSKTP